MKILLLLLSIDFISFVDCDLLLQWAQCLDAEAIALEPYVIKILEDHLSEQRC